MDSLAKTIKNEPGRFLKYVDFRRVQSIDDFILEFKHAFDSTFGRNMLNYMSDIHWGLLLNADKTQSHFKRIERQKQLKEFLKDKIFDKVVDILKDKKEHEDVKFVEVKTARGKEYRRGYSKWTKKQESFLKRMAGKSFDKIFDSYNRAFANFRSKSSLKSKIRRMKQ